MIYIILSTLPFLIAISLIIWKDEPILPMLLSIFIGLWVVYRFNPISAFLNMTGTFIINSFTKSSNIFFLTSMVEILILYYFFREKGNFKTLTETKKFKKSNKNLIEYILLGSSFLLSFDERLAVLINGVFIKYFAFKKNIEKKRFSFILNNFAPAFYSLIPLTLFTPIITKIIGGSLTSLGIDYSSFRIYLLSIPFQFYNIFILAIITSSVALKKDIPQMKFETDSVDNFFRIAPINSNTRIKNANINETIFGVGISLLIIIVTLISFSTFSLISFYHNSPVEIQTTQRIFTSLIFGGTIYYIIYSLILKKFCLKEIYNKKQLNINSTLIAIFYLILSFTLSLIADRLNYVEKVTEIIFANNKISLPLFPFIFFLITSALGFLIGSRLVVLSIIIPIAFKAISVLLSDPLLIDYYHFAVLGAIISGSTFGVINSPLSPLFIISASVSEISIKKHFTSQIYYSIGAMLNTLIFGFLFTFFRISPYISIATGILITSLIFMFWKKLIEL